MEHAKDVLLKLTTRMEIGQALGIHIAKTLV
jgi:hypothetical protein